jgi:hypothetical protein
MKNDEEEEKIVVKEDAHGEFLLEASGSFEVFEDNQQQ